jgi:transcriptional regulator CtsR
MGSLADQIEQYIKKMLEESRHRKIRLNRCQLAEMFSCVPSQINYVLSTRFSPERGYYVESRRGGGGYVLIARLAISENEGVAKLIGSIPDQVSERQSHDLIQYLYEEDFLTKREAMLMAALTQGATLTASAPEEDVLRANIVRVMLQTILRNDFVD